MFYFKLLKQMSMLIFHYSAPVLRAFCGL